MRRMMAPLILGIGLAGAVMADPIEGMWKTQPDDGVFYHVRMQQCGSALCGVFEQKFEGGQQVASPVIGKNAVFDMLPNGNGKYVGKAFKPSNGKTYKGKGELNGETLKMSGCVLGILCLSQTWERLQ